ncbi:hypothetical protein [endosymbiont GvMRE of Glomus versiforme]|uniref:hypothetical protein n=1 Tax=endosymbiont GvMRE of Glomus versiforme TaxID=2039283 RepID=UPI000ED2E3BB|nr:hypothetical protein [endosymbiont GvMRE of Glomus versiforme]RHZ37444.1 hypothetical protein GvMRE_I1g136 [endosymbiont GvMRE of Glomus versiforme]
MTKYSLEEFEKWLTDNKKWGTSAMHVYISNFKKPSLWEVACQGKATEEYAANNGGFYILPSRYETLLKWVSEVDQRERERERAARRWP